MCDYSLEHLSSRPAKVGTSLPILVDNGAQTCWRRRRSQLSPSVAFAPYLPSVFPLKLAVDLFAARWPTIVAVILLAAAVAYLDLASKRIPTVTMAHAGPAPAVSVAHEEQAPVSRMVCVREGVAPACNCVGWRPSSR